MWTLYKYTNIFSPSRYIQRKNGPKSEFLYNNKIKVQLFICRASVRFTDVRWNT